jgi:UDP-N-acetyl-D-glucosamine dehydrogenase
MDLNVWEVLDAANTKPFGIMPFYPGPGVGGHCIPIDPHYLEWKAKEFNFNTRFIGLAGEINRRMPEFVKDKAWRVLNNLGLALKNAKVLAIGVAYKKDISDWRESPAMDVIESLLQDHAKVSYHDPYVSNVTLGPHQLHSVELSIETLKAADLVIILTEHNNIDYEFIVCEAKAVLDTRGITRKLGLSSSQKTKVTLL